MKVVPHRVAARLFTGLAVLAVLTLAASLIGVLSFKQSQTLFDRIASKQLTSMHDATELRQETQTLTGLAPSLFAKELDQRALLFFATEAYDQQVAIQSLIESLNKSIEDRSRLQSIAEASNALFENVDVLATAIYDKAAAETEFRQSIGEIVSIHMDARRYMAAVSKDSRHRGGYHVRRWLSAVDALSVTVLKAITFADEDQLSALSFDLTALLADAGNLALAGGGDTARLTEFQTRLMKVATGPRGIVALRQALAANRSEIEELLKKNDRFSRELTEGVDALEGQIRDDIQHDGQSFGAILAERSNVMLGLGVLGLIGAVGVGAYFNKSVIGRMNSLRDAMISEDAVRGAKALTRGQDEIAEMAASVLAYVDGINQRDRAIQMSQQRLTDAIESLDDGFSLYDAGDVLVTCNARYGELLYPGMEGNVRVGETFESIVRRSAERGLIPHANGRIEEWLVERMARHRNPQSVIVQERHDGRCIEIKERKTEGGDTVAIYSDITEQRTAQLDLMNALQQVKDQNLKLESLSNKLSKYLSPQLYSTIFSGQRTVEVSSIRKKLTVFLSDIADFTEIADTMESEELTTLLNHYLTEMSNIALAHGATIDKFIGDAILLFFGDPETRGPKEDALACVEMAIAMQQRARELRLEWRERGIARPFQLRMGITTGYCTVGNFGSADRMDYTIIGNEVNLAARLQAQADLGGILLAHETYSLVKDRIAAEEREPIAVKGLAKPVKTYRVVGVHDEDPGATGVVDHESEWARIHVHPEKLSPEAKREVRRTVLRLLSVIGE